MRIFERHQFNTCLLKKMLQPSCTELETLKLNVTNVLCIMLQIKTLANLIFVPLKFLKKSFILYSLQIQKAIKENLLIFYKIYKYYWLTTEKKHCMWKWNIIFFNNSCKRACNKDFFQPDLGISYHIPQHWLWI